ncbi:MAG: DUF5118 domain-containing protein, partial [Bacteroidales bacterium]|nr:DUF5118 domain-containing protein [Bacteroidales bacterium]
MKKIYVLSALFIIACNLCSASAATPQNKPKKADSVTPAAKKDSLSAYDKLFKDKHESVKGMFTLHKIKEKVYFE